MAQCEVRVHAMFLYFLTPVCLSYLAMPFFVLVYQVHTMFDAQRTKNDTTTLDKTRHEHMYTTQNHISKHTQAHSHAHTFEKRPPMLFTPTAHEVTVTLSLMIADEPRPQEPNKKSVNVYKTPLKRNIMLINLPHSLTLTVVTLVTRRPDFLEYQLKTLNLNNVEELLELHDKLPLVLRDVVSEKLFQRVDALPADGGVERVRLLEVAAIHGLVGAFDLDGDRGLALFAHLDLLVVALDRCAKRTRVSMRLEGQKWDRLTLYRVGLFPSIRLQGSS